MLKKIIKKIKDKNIVIAVVGLGFVGLPLSIRFIQSGHKVLGIDQDSKKTNLIKKGISYISSIKNTELDYFKKNNLSYESVTMETNSERRAAYLAGRCDVMIVNDLDTLNSFPNPSNHTVINFK